VVAFHYGMPIAKGRNLKIYICLANNILEEANAVVPIYDEHCGWWLASFTQKWPILNFVGV